MVHREFKLSTLIDIGLSTLIDIGNSYIKIMEGIKNV